MKKNTTLKTHIGYWINRLQTRVDQAFETRLKEYGVTGGQWCVLISLFDKQAGSVTSLAKYIEISKPVVSRTIEQLVKKDLVLVLKGEDRRSEKILLTKKAVKLVPLLIKEASDVESHFFSCLSQKELQQLKAILKILFINKTKITPSGWLIEETNYE
ncbi:MAG: MarR family winged helix-turn-helix transcriptional regulator [Neisseriaceae bacterium]